MDNDECIGCAPRLNPGHCTAMELENSKSSVYRWRDGEYPTQTSSCLEKVIMVHKV